MTPIIGITCSTLVLSGMRGVPRFALVHHYVDCVMRAGGLPLMLPNVTTEAAAAYLARIDGLVLSGGLDIDPIFYGQEPLPQMGKIDQVRDAFELEMTRGAHEAGIPILAICRGIQVLNVAFGGTLVQDIDHQVDGAIRHAQDTIRHDAVSHTIDIEEGTRLHEIAGVSRTRVNTFHHQSPDRVPEPFVISARTVDGVIEGIEDPSHPYCVGVQWHPERTSQDGFSVALFDSFVSAALDVKKRTIRAAGSGPA
ncbi:MAG: gamma-glutamyl-gamma-aminobutyrate hydrolase family protein [Planctomycetota bacterium]|jgi:putative glutamine amidotransferase